MYDRVIGLFIKLLVLGGGGLLVTWMKKQEGKVKAVALIYVIGQGLFLCLTVFVQILMIFLTIGLFQEGETGRACGFVFVSIFMFLGTMQRIRMMQKSILKMLGKEVENKQVVEEVEDI